MPIEENSAWVIKTTNECISFQCWKFFNRVNIDMQNYMCIHTEKHSGPGYWNVSGSQFGD